MQIVFPQYMYKMYLYVFNLYKPAATFLWFDYELPSSQVLFYAIIRLITDVVE
jgi:hypothetical protein